MYKKFSVIFIGICSLNAMKNTLEQESPEAQVKILRRGPQNWLHIIDEYTPEPEVPSLVNLPKELKILISELLVESNTLEEAVTNIRNAFSIHRSFAPLVNDIQVNATLIKALESKFFPSQTIANQVEVAVALDTKGARLWLENVINKDGLLAKDSAVMFKLLKRADQENYNPLIRLLVEKGARLNVQDREGNTPLLISIKKLNPSLALCLLSFGYRRLPNPRSREELGITLRNNQKQLPIGQVGRVIERLRESSEEKDKEQLRKFNRLQFGLFNPHDIDPNSTC